MEPGACMLHNARALLVEPLRGLFLLSLTGKKNPTCVGFCFWR